MRAFLMTSLIPNVSYGAFTVWRLFRLSLVGKSIYTFLSSIGKKQNSLKEQQTSSETQRECEFGARNNRWTTILNLSFNGVALEEVISGRGWSPLIPATLSGTCHCAHG